MKVMTIVGTRPEIIKLAETIKELDKYTEHVLVHTGQNYDYELNQVFFKELGIRKPNYFLEAASGGVAKTIGTIIAKSDQVMAKEKPEAILLYGDTNSCLSVIAAKRRKIPVFHMEAGNRSFDQRVPEEINRKVVDHLSDINMVLTEHARRYLIAEGIKPQMIIKTGSSMKELLDKYAKKINESKILKKLSLEKDRYFVVSAHREENVESETNFASLCDSLNLLAKTYRKPIIFSVHPRTRKRMETVKLKFDPLIKFSRPFGFLDYLKLQTNALCVLSDSGTITEESSILGFPAITIRETQERPEGMDEGTLIMSGLKPNAVLSAVKVTIDQYKANKKQFKTPTDYEVDNVSKKVVKIILSYVEYVNREVWKK